MKLAPRQLNLEFYRHDPANPGSISPNAVNAMYAAADGTLYAVADKTTGGMVMAINADGSLKWKYDTNTY